jgi:hypothetical protein
VNGLIEFSVNGLVKFNENDLIILCEYLSIKETFSQEREENWKARLVELAANPIPLKKS